MAATFLFDTTFTLNGCDVVESVGFLNAIFVDKQ